MQQHGELHIDQTNSPGSLTHLSESRRSPETKATQARPTRVPLMAVFDREASKPHNLDQTSCLGSTELAEVVAGSADERRRRTAKIGGIANLLDSRAGPYAPDPCMITTKICGELLVYEREDFNGLILILTVGCCSATDLGESSLPARSRSHRR